MTADNSYRYCHPSKKQLMGAPAVLPAGSGPMTLDPDAQYRRDITRFIRAMVGPVDYSDPPPGFMPPSLDVEGMTVDERHLAAWDAAEMMRDTDPYAAGFADGADHAARVVALEYVDQPGYEPSWHPDLGPQWDFDK